MTEKRMVWMIPALALVFTAGLPLSAFAQAAARSWYVSPKGKDDNNGRSPEQAFVRLTKAFESAAQSNVKTITIIGEFDYRWSSSPHSASDTGAAEILVTGVDSASCEYELGIYGNSNVRIENLTFKGNDRGIQVYGEKAALTLGQNAVVNRLTLNGGARITMQANASLSTGFIEGGTFTMKDDTRIEGGGIEIDHAEQANTVILRDNAVVNGCRIGIEIYAGTLLLSGKASITNCTSSSPDGVAGSGISIHGGDVTLQDEASITSNGGKDGSGGGVYINGGTLVVKGRARISGNKARRGGGIYYRGGGEYQFTNPKNTVTAAVIPVLIQDQAQITGNEAKEGGGVYIEGGGAMTGVHTFTVADQWGNGALANAAYKYSQFFAAGVTMNGGAISGNKADYGAGVYAAAVSEYELTRIDLSRGGTTRVFHDVRDGIVPTGQKSEAAAFACNGGSVTGNEAQFVGGGVFVKVKGAYAAGKGTVSGNTAGDGEGEDVFTP